MGGAGHGAHRPAVASNLQPPPPLSILRDHLHDLRLGVALHLQHWRRGEGGGGGGRGGGSG